MTDATFGVRPHDPDLCIVDGQTGDAYWYCAERAIPGGIECPGCLVARVHHHAQAEYGALLRQEAGRIFPVTVIRPEQFGATA